MNPSEIARVLAEMGAAPAKSRGQNFLVDDRVADRQIEYAELSQQDTVLEVGPGLGMLTGRLAASAGRVIAIGAIDNLVKGAAGQAVQNMNIRFGIDETAGLTTAVASPL